MSELQAAGASVLREPADMPWGERVAFLRDPEGNVVTLAGAYLDVRVEPRRDVAGR